jgi:catechol 2,3-dioxygenase-like lactoylglutathione lyase family enzyme
LEQARADEVTLEETAERIRSQRWAEHGPSAQVVGIHHVQLAMPPGEEETARGFYRDVLGLQEIPKPPKLAERGGCWFAGPNTAIHLGVEEGFSPAMKAHPALIVGDLDAIAERLGQHGIPVQPDDGIPGLRRVYTSDPFGNRIELVEAKRLKP